MVFLESDLPCLLASGVPWGSQRRPVTGHSVCHLLSPWTRTRLPAALRSPATGEGTEGHMGPEACQATQPRVTGLWWPRSSWAGASTRGPTPNAGGPLTPTGPPAASTGGYTVAGPATGQAARLRHPECRTQPSVPAICTRGWAPPASQKRPGPRAASLGRGLGGAGAGAPGTAAEPWRPPSPSWTRSGLGSPGSAA